MILAEADSTAWGLVAILCSAIFALVGSVTALIIARLNRQSVKHEELRGLLHQSIGASRERMSRIESRIEESMKKGDHNDPLQWDSIRALERWQAGMVVRCKKCEQAKAGS